MAQMLKSLLKQKKLLTIQYRQLSIFKPLM